MEVSVARKSDWVLTGDAFERLLRTLDADRERAGEVYELLRRKLTEFFEARGGSSPADHVDETLNRAARKLAEGEQVDDISRYLYGVARLVFLELTRAQTRNPVALDAVAQPLALSVPNDEDEEQRQAQRERRFECFEECLRQLNDENRALIVSYYKGEKGEKIKERKQQATALGLSLNALRLRAARIRAVLERCISECLRDN